MPRRIIASSKGGLLALLTILPGIAAFAQTPSLQPAFGTVTDTGFSEEHPYMLNMTAGGDLDAAGLGTGCIGNVAEAPDLVLAHQADGQPLYLYATSTGDTSLLVHTPAGNWVCDDDSLGDFDPLLALNPETGNYAIWVGTVNDEEYADATLFIASREPDQAELQSMAWFGNDFSGTVIQDELSAGGNSRENGAWTREFTVHANAGELMTVDMRSRQIDTWLTVMAPSGERFTNDDYHDDVQRSLLALQLAESGEYLIEASSYSAKESGAFIIGIERHSPEATSFTEATGGTLDSHSEADAAGYYSRTHTFEGISGQFVDIDLSSTEFDTVLTLVSPRGMRTRNDDSDEAGHSRIQSVLDESGTWQVLISSYAAGELGDYSLHMEGSFSELITANPGQQVLPLFSGQTLHGSLSSSGTQRADTYSFSGEQGERLRFTLESSDFDTWLEVTTPSGSTLENDDYAESIERSMIELILPEDGEYLVRVSSYEQQGTGVYSLSALTSHGDIDHAAGIAGSRVFGVFVGISDYSVMRQIDEGWYDLENTAADAIVIHDALTLRTGLALDDAVMLLDDQATLANLRTAMQEMAGRVGPEDTFLFFFSGHGDQQPRPDGYSASDADGLDETLVFSNGMLTDDELAGLLDEIDAATTLVVIDSCYSGGFAKDLISRPGRMGLFSSEEDVPSMVAEKFRAGGYLSHFFREGVEQGSADGNRDGFISAIELSQYLHDRYRDEKLGKTPDGTRDQDFGFQHLITDRGGVGSEAILFTLYHQVP